MDFSNIGDLMRKTQAAIVEKGFNFKDTDVVINVSMIVFLFSQHTWVWVEFAVM